MEQSLFQKIKRQVTRTLFKKIMIFMVGIALIPLIISAHSVVNLDTIHNREIESRQNDVINRIMDQLNGRLGSLSISLQPQYSRSNIIHLATFAGATPIFDVISKEDLELLLDRIIEQNNSIALVSLFDGPSGREIMARSSTPGNNIVPSAEILASHSIKEMSFFKQALTGKPYISPIYSTADGSYVLIASPIRNAEHDVPGIIVAYVNMRTVLNAVLAGNNLEAGEYAYVTDGKGRLLAHSDTDSAAPVNVRSIPFVSGLLFEGAKTEGQSRYVSFWNKQVVAAGSVFPDPKLAVVVEWPTEDADYIVDQTRNRFILFTLLSLNLSILLSIFVARIIVGPIKKLQEGTKKIEDGKFDDKISIKTGDELEDLGNSFNEMMGGLKRLQELRDEFVFIAAHELRTPVTAIKGYVSLIQEDAANIEQNKQFLSQVQIANKRLLDLVEDLLEVARSEAGRLQIKVVPISITQPVKEVLAELKPLADEKKIAMHYEGGPIPNVLGDERRIKEVVINLVGNAIKYTAGEGSVTITHEQKDKMLITHIKDAGLGISKEAQEKLFQKFYRVQTVKTQDIQGTGLGLFIVKQIIEKMNGSIWVESEEGKGSTFSFSLPLEHPDESR